MHFNKKEQKPKSENENEPSKKKSVYRPSVHIYGRYGQMQKSTTREARKTIMFKCIKMVSKNAIEPK